MMFDGPSKTDQQQIAEDIAVAVFVVSRISILTLAEIATETSRVFGERAPDAFALSRFVSEVLPHLPPHMREALQEKRRYAC